VEQRNVIGKYQQMRKCAKARINDSKSCKRENVNQEKKCPVPNRKNKEQHNPPKSNKGNAPVFQTNTVQRMNNLLGSTYHGLY
jgi:hypothetical protein